MSNVVPFRAPAGTSVLPSDEATVFVPLFMAACYMLYAEASSDKSSELPELRQSVMAAMRGVPAPLAVEVPERLYAAMQRISFVDLVVEMKAKFTEDTSFA